MRSNLHTSPQRIETPADSNQQPKHWWESLWCWLFALPLAMLTKGCLSRSMLLVMLSLLLFFLLAWLLLRGCNRSNSGKDGLPPDFTYVQPDPSRPIPRIDPSKLRPSRDSTITIVSDRINVLLEKKDDNTGLLFQQEFKRLYPDPAYQFVHFDSLTYRLQVQIPENMHDFLMDNLNSQMPQFEFLLFEESVFYANYIPSDPAHHSNDGKDWYFRAIKCYEAWDVTMGDPNILVAVVDNGFDAKHPKIASKIVHPYNMADRSSTLFPPEGNGHGTHVAATAVGLCDTGDGISGIAPGCSLIPVQVASQDGAMCLSDILDGVLYAIYKGADVINVSLGNALDPRLQFLSPADQLDIIMGLRKNEERVWDEVFKIAANKHCTLVLAAGNENVLSGFDAMKRSDQTIIVSAVDQEFKRSIFAQDGSAGSNYGNYSDIPYCFSTVSAPGSEIYNAVPGNSYDYKQGTSMAAPIVTGAVALLKSVNHDLTTLEIIDVLQNTGIVVSDPIGNVIQLDAAIKAVQTGNYARQAPNKPGLGNPGNKLRTGDIIDDPTNLYGLWKASDGLINMHNDAIDLYMSFSKSRNDLIIVETANNDARYTAPLDVSISNGSVIITQLNEAYNPNGSGYNIYTFKCSTDTDGSLRCDAINKNGSLQVSFNLYKIR